MMIQLRPDNIEEEILNSSKMCVVTFKSSGCHLCRGLNKVIFKLRRKYFKDYKFAEVDVDTQENLAQIFKVDGVPTMFVFKDGDAAEIPYPDDPNLVSGYHEGGVVEFLDYCLDGGVFEEDD